MNQKRMKFLFKTIFMVHGREHEPWRYQAEPGNEALEIILQKIKGYRLQNQDLARAKIGNV